MDLKKSINEIYNELDFLEIKLLQFSQKDFEVLRNLEFHHNDPFDRIIIAQAISNNFDVITRDNNFKPYSIKLFGNNLNLILIRYFNKFVPNKFNTDYLFFYKTATL